MSPSDGAALTDRKEIGAAFSGAYKGHMPTTAQTEALQGYMDTDYEGMNAYLRSDGADMYGSGLGGGFSGGGRKKTPEEIAAIRERRLNKITTYNKDLRELIEHSPKTPKPVEVHRVAGGDVGSGLSVGDTFIDKGFLSVTYDKDVLSQFHGDDGIFFGEDDEVSVFNFVLPAGSTAISASHLGGWEGQHEIILPPGSKFRVTGKKTDGLVTTITLEVVR